MCKAEDSTKEENESPVRDAAQIQAKELYNDDSNDHK